MLKRVTEVGANSDLSFSPGLILMHPDTPTRTGWQRLIHSLVTADVMADGWQGANRLVAIHVSSGTCTHREIHGHIPQKLSHPDNKRFVSHLKKEKSQEQFHRASSPPAKQQNLVTRSDPTSYILPFHSASHLSLSPPSSHSDSLWPCTLPGSGPHSRRTVWTASSSKPPLPPAPPACPRHWFELL